MRAAKFLRDLRLKIKRKSARAKFKSKISKLSSHLLKFKSESEILKSAVSLAVSAHSKPLKI